MNSDVTDKSYFPQKVQVPGVSSLPLSLSLQLLLICKLGPLQVVNKNNIYKRGNWKNWFMGGKQTNKGEF